MVNHQAYRLVIVCGGQGDGNPRLRRLPHLRLELHTAAGALLGEHALEGETHQTLLHLFEARRAQCVVAQVDV